MACMVLNCVDEDQHIVIVKIVNVQTQDVNVEIKLQGMVGQKPED
jgi:alpha-L-arabinofuranosidase